MAVEKPSVLIFSRNDTEKVIELANSIHNIAREIVVIDSSGPDQLKKLNAAKEKFHGMRVIHAVALGYADPLRMYALKMCKSRWVFLIDPDERPSRSLKESVKFLIKTPHTSAFAIRRYEETQEAKRGAFWTWQVRLFDKSKVSFTGMIHEQPAVEGNVESLAAEDVYLYHAEHKGAGSSGQYGKMRMFLDKMSYKSYNDRMIDYIGKMTLPKKADETFFGKSIVSLMKASQKIRGKKPDEELSPVDYMWFYLFLDLGYSIKKRDILNVFKSLPERWRYVSKMRKERDSEEAKEIFGISRRLNEVGLIGFLHLDDPKRIAQLNKKYKNKQQGIDLLVSLLKEQYKKERGVA